MTGQHNKFRNVIVCDDIRDELGNKKSLMGVLGGDILVATFPATIQIAIYMEYIPDQEDGDHLSVEFRLLQDEVEIVKGGVAAEVSRGQSATFVLPKGLVIFEKEAIFRLCASVNGGPEQELLRKRIGKTPATS